MPSENMVEIPIPWKAANKIFTASLENTRYQFQFRWNRRSFTWGFTIISDEGVVLVSSMAVHVNWNFLDPWRHIEILPTGNLICICTDNTKVSPGRYELGQGRRVRMFYEPAI